MTVTRTHHAHTPTLHAIHDDGWATQQRPGRTAERGARGFVDPRGRMLGLHLYEGQLKIIPITSGHFKTAFDLKLEEMNVL